MLKSLYISSFVIIDQLHIDFQEGMNVLTGETGAGKSIIIDALGQLCGNRASVSLIKKNASKAIIEGIFDIIPNQDLQNICEELHVECDDQIVITKEIFQTGKSNVKINYQNASNNALKLIMPFLIDIHSQFETQKLFEEKNHIQILDEYASKDLSILKKDYENAYSQYKDLSSKLDKAINEDMSDEQLEFLQNQLNEIEQNEYTDDEVNELEKELELLKNYEKVNEKIHSFDQLMNASSGILPQLKDALYVLQSITDYGDFQDAYEKLYDQYYNIEDEYENIMDIYHDFHFDEYRFNELQDTLFQINRLKRKYGYTMERILEYKEELKEKIYNINRREEFILSLKKQLHDTENRCMNIAKDIHNIRKKNAKQFEEDIMGELQDLYLDKAVFKIHFEKTKIQKEGIDKIQFMVSINKGQDLSLLNETASGGEISRIMLAIKTIILQYNTIETIVFDEVDTGVSGKVASRIGEKMRHLSLKKQVLCITHLPQVACLGHYHYSIEKKSQTDDTVTSIRLLTNEERIMEIAKMLSGDRITNEAIENAKQLLNV